MAERASLEVGLTQISERAAALQRVILDLEHNLAAGHDAISWHDALDRFAALQVGLQNLLKQVDMPQMPQLNAQLLVPQALSTEQDEHLQVVTGGRASNFTHSLVPQLLRTKPEPEVAEADNVLRQETAAWKTEEEARQRLDALCGDYKAALQLLDSKRKQFTRATVIQSKYTSPMAAAANDAPTAKLSAAVRSGAGWQRCTAPSGPAGRWRLFLSTHRIPSLLN